MVNLNGEGSSANLVSRSVAKDESHQVFISRLNGNTCCAGHTECDAIIMDHARIEAVPELTANNIDAALIHEAVSYTHLDVYKRQGSGREVDAVCVPGGQ